MDDGLEILGDSGKAAIYYYLERNVGLKKEGIPEKPDLFIKGLTMIFGEEGAAFVERNLVKTLTTRFNLKSQSETTLTGTLAMIKERQKSLHKKEHTNFRCELGKGNSDKNKRETAEKFHGYVDPRRANEQG